MKDGYRCFVVRLDYATGNFSVLIKRDATTLKALPTPNTHSYFVYVAGQWKAVGALV